MTLNSNYRISNIVYPPIKFTILYQEEYDPMKSRDTVFSVFLIIFLLAFLSLIIASKLTNGTPVILVPGLLMIVLLVGFAICLFFFSLALSLQEVVNQIIQHALWIIATIIISMLFWNIPFQW